MPKTQVIPKNVAATADWQAARQTLDAIQHHGRLFLAGQILLGWQLAELKKSLGFVGRGSHKKQKDQSGLLGKTTWKDLVEKELCIPENTSKRFVNLYEACRAKLKRLGHQRAVALLGTGPADLNEQQRKEVEKLVTKVSDGDTQKSLLLELKLIKSPQGSSATGGNLGGGGKSQSPTMEQLALALFAEPLNQFANLRTNKDYQACLHNLPLHSDDPADPTLDTLEAETQALLADIQSAKKSRTGK